MRDPACTASRSVRLFGPLALKLAKMQTAVNVRIRYSTAIRGPSLCRGDWGRFRPSNLPIQPGQSHFNQRVSRA